MNGSHQNGQIRPCLNAQHKPQLPPHFKCNRNSHFLARAGIDGKIPRPASSRRNAPPCQSRPAMPDQQYAPAAQRSALPQGFAANKARRADNNQQG